MKSTIWFLPDYCCVSDDGTLARDGARFKGDDGVIRQVEALREQFPNASVTVGSHGTIIVDGGDPRPRAEFAEVPKRPQANLSPEALRHQVTHINGVPVTPYGKCAILEDMVAEGIVTREVASEILGVAIDNPTRDAAIDFREQLLDEAAAVTRLANTALYSSSLPVSDRKRLESTCLAARDALEEAAAYIAMRLELCPPWPD